MKKMLSRFKNWFELKEKPFPEEEVSCKNCEHSFKGNFCPNCGQSIKEIDQPFSFVIYDFMGTMFAFDSRFFRSLFTIIAKPGQITSDFVAGKRAKYMPPFRFYIFISFVFFFLLTSTLKNKVGEFERNSTIDSLKVSLNEDAQVVLDSLNTQLSSPDIIGEVLDDTIQNINSVKEIGDLLLAEIEKDSSFSESGTGRIVSQFKKAKEYPEIYITKYFKYFSWALFFLMPVFALILKLLYSSQKSNYIRHFIFSVNLHAFIFFVLTIILLAHLLFTGPIVGIFNYLALIIPIYLVMGMKKFYQQKTGKTILKAFLISAIYNFVILAALFVIAYYAFINF